MHFSAICWDLLLKVTKKQIVAFFKRFARTCFLHKKYSSTIKPKIQFGSTFIMNLFKNAIKNLTIRYGLSFQCSKNRIFHLFYIYSYSVTSLRGKEELSAPDNTLTTLSLKHGPSRNRSLEKSLYLNNCWRLFLSLCNPPVLPVAVTPLVDHIGHGSLLEISISVFTKKQ